MSIIVKDTSKLLTKLRSLMLDKSLFNGNLLEAYIIPSSDSHGSEYLCEKDKRRQFISNFTGSSGILYLYFYSKNNIFSCSCVSVCVCALACC